MINTTIKRSGGIEKYLSREIGPFFTFVIRGAQSTRSNTTDGKFAFQLEQGQGYGYYTGSIMPITLCDNSHLREKLMKAVEYLKSLQYESNMTYVRKTFQRYLNEHGLGALKFETQQDLHGFVSFKIDQGFFESVLPHLHYVTALDIAAEKGQIIEHQPSPWKHWGDTMFWMHESSKKKNAGYASYYETPKLYLVFESVEHPVLSYRHSQYQEEKTSVDLPKYFDLKKDVIVSTLDKVWIDETKAGWSAIYLTVNGVENQIICSNAFDPFETLLHFARVLDEGGLPLSFTIDEEGTDKQFEAYDTATEDRFYFILSNPNAEDRDIFVEGIFSKKEFSSKMKAAFKDFLEHRYIDEEWDWYADKNEPSFKERLLNDPWINS